ncbi:MAG: hypothetical protein M3456_07650 [Actinomycetota bacterium]|nr:hypothetical protein [Actinomycetota bacterium]
MPNPEISQHNLGPRDLGGTGRFRYEANGADIDRLSRRKRLALVLRFYSDQLHDQGAFMGANLIRHAAAELEEATDA